jgi:hypothetical protein
MGLQLFGSFMITDISDRLNKLRRALGSESPPKEITQRDFEAGPEHLYRLARLRTDEEADGRDLCEYMLDLLYTDIQVSLFVYVLPFCLKAWYRALRAEDFKYPGFVDQFYPVLENREVFEKHLKPRQANAVLDFMRASILDEIDAQKGLYFRGYPARPFRWIRAMTTYGVIAPDVNEIWMAFWSVETIGRAIAAVQYISCLMYPKDGNPVFAPWTREEGGGPPCLWEFDGFLYENRWQQSNVDFLEKFLNTPESVSEVLALAVERLTDQPEHQSAAKILADLPSCTRTLVDRCAMLPLLLATPGATRETFDWPT